MTKTAETKWAPRSQASLKRETALRQQVRNVETQISQAGRFLTKDERLRDSMQDNITRTGSFQPNLGRVLAEIEERKLTIRSLREVKAGLETQIEAECRIPEGRAASLDKLAKLARARLESDAATEKLLEGVRASLAKRREITAEMRALAPALEFSGDFDEARFDALERSVGPVLPESQRRTRLLLGETGAGIVRCIARVHLEIGETFFRAGIFEPGEEVLLSQEEFDELSQAQLDLGVDETTLADEIPKRYVPARVCSPEQFAADKAAGSDVRDVWAGQDFEDREARIARRSVLCTQRRWDRLVEEYSTRNGWSSEQARREVERFEGPRPVAA